MVVSTASDVAPLPERSEYGAFRAAPTSVKVVTATFFLPLLLSLGQALASIAGLSGHGADPDSLFAFNLGIMNDSVEWWAVRCAGAGFVLGMALTLISFLLRKATARGPLGSWLLTLVPVVLAVLFALHPFLNRVDNNYPAAGEYAFVAVAEASVYVFLGLVLALISCQLGRGIAHEALSAWLLTLGLVVLALLVGVPSVLDHWTVYSILNVVITVAVLALLLTPVVRRHCAKR